MNKIYQSIVSILILIAFFLSKSIFFGDNNYSYRSNLINENNKQKSENKDLKKQNEILEFEIKSAQNSNDHVENFAREKLNLTLPEEEFILFKEETKKEKDERK